MMCAWEHANGRSIVGELPPSGNFMSSVASCGRQGSTGT
jgi:hypothetical protein